MALTGENTTPPASGGRFPSVLLCSTSLVNPSVFMCACSCLPPCYHSPIQLPAASTCQLPTTYSSVSDSSWTLVLKPWLFIQSSPDCFTHFTVVDVLARFFMFSFIQKSSSCAITNLVITFFGAFLCVSSVFCAFPHLVTFAHSQIPLAAHHHSASPHQSPRTQVSSSIY